MILSFILLIFSFFTSYIQLSYFSYLLLSLLRCKIGQIGLILRYHFADGKQKINWKGHAIFLSIRSLQTLDKVLQFHRPINLKKSRGQSYSTPKNQACQSFSWQNFIFLLFCQTCCQLHQNKAITSFFSQKLKRYK